MTGRAGRSILSVNSASFAAMSSPAGGNCSSTVPSPYVDSSTGVWVMIFHPAAWTQAFTDWMFL